MKIFCDYCGKTADITPDELADWLVTDPESGAQMVTCSSCENAPNTASTGQGGAVSVEAALLTEIIYPRKAVGSRRPCR